MAGEGQLCLFCAEVCCNCISEDFDVCIWAIGMAHFLCVVCVATPTVALFLLLLCWCCACSPSPPCPLFDPYLHLCRRTCLKTQL